MWGMSDEGWSTEAELRWLERIGTHGEPGARTPRQPWDRAELLRGYLAGSRLRVMWGPIHAPTVIERAQEMLAEEMAP